MRRVTWKEFVALPAGTIFTEARKGYMGAFESLRVKGETAVSPTVAKGYETDYVEADLMPNYGYAFSLCGAEIMDDGTEVVVNSAGFGRDSAWEASHGENEYWVWDRWERERLARWLLDPHAALIEVNDEDNLIWREDDGRVRTLLLVLQEHRQRERTS